MAIQSPPSRGSTTDETVDPQAERIRPLRKLTALTVLLIFPFLFGSCGTTVVGASTALDGDWYFATICDGEQRDTDCFTVANGEITIWLGSCIYELRVTESSITFDAATGNLAMTCSASGPAARNNLALTGTLLQDGSVVGSARGVAYSLATGEIIAEASCTFTMTRR